MKGSDSEFGGAVLSWLASPMMWCAGTLLIFIALARWQTFQSRRGGVLLTAGLLSLLALAASQAIVLEELLVPARLVVLLFLGINLFALWCAFHERLPQTSQPKAPSSDASSPSPTELWMATAVGLSVFAAAFFWDVPSAPSGRADFFQGELQLHGFLAPWMADIFVPCLLLATLIALPWLHRPPEQGPPVEAIPQNTGLIFFGLAWLLYILLPLAVSTFQDLPEAFVDGSSAEATTALPVHTLAQFFWHRAMEMEMPSWWFFRESPGIVLLVLYFVLPPYALPRLRTSRGFCRRCHRALGVYRYSVLLTLLLFFSLAPLKMVSLWWFGIGEWIAIPEFSLYF